MKKKVFVSGCYDMLHSGHVAFFTEAAEWGDLYVGIGSDKTIFDLKGRKTIHSEKERLYMVRALKSVKQAFINKGSGILDFKEDILESALEKVLSDNVTFGKSPNNFVVCVIFVELKLTTELGLQSTPKLSVYGIVFTNFVNILIY
jgi:cytidyltransferase-like protein